MKRRQKFPRHGREYRVLHEEMRTECGQAKEECLNENAEIERMIITDKADMNKNVRELTIQNKPYARNLRRGHCQKGK